MPPSEAIRSDAKLHKADSATSKTSVSSSSFEDQSYTVAPQQNGVVVVQETQAPTSAPPPWHTVSCIVLFLAIFLQTLPTLAKLDEVARVETFSFRLFPNHLSVRQLAWVRAFMAAAIFTTTIAMATGPGWIQQTAYLKASKLKRIKNHLVGVKTLFPFTSWSWNLLGISFTLSSYIAFQALGNVPVSPVVLRLALVSWEIAAPNTLLVASVVRYAIWPGILRLPNGSTDELRSMRNFMMHNMNVVFALTESCILSGLPVRWSDAALAPLWGVLYVLFTWFMIHRWNDPEHGPQFIYFFFDTTLPGYTPTKILLLLFSVLMFFYGIFCSTNALLGFLDGGLLTHFLFLGVISSLVMRFRD
jgi:hypothetical protein